MIVFLVCVDRIFGLCSPRSEDTPENNTERNDGKEARENYGSELFIEQHDKVASATFESEKDEKDLRGYPPLREAHPRPKDRLR